MSFFSSKDLIEEIILHEILGFQTTVSEGNFNLIIEDNNAFIVSGVNIINFASGIQATNVGGNQVDIALNNDLDLTSNRLTLPQGGTLPGVVRKGEFFYNDNEQQLYVGTDSSTWEEVSMAAARVTLLDEVPASSYTYVGEATPGTATSAASWRIYRLDESGTGAEELIKLYANNSTNFDQVWDSRASLSYILPT